MNQTVKQQVMGIVHEYENNVKRYITSISHGQKVAEDAKAFSDGNYPRSVKPYKQAFLSEE